MNESVELRWAPGVEKALTETIPDEIIKDIARETLDLTYPTIPENTGKMKRESKAAGVKGSNGEYWIGSYTKYAKFVYVRDNNKTNWTTPGTNSYWFKEYWLKHGKNIIEVVLERNRKK